MKYFKLSLLIFAVLPLSGCGPAALAMMQSVQYLVAGTVVQEVVVSADNAAYPADSYVGPDYLDRSVSIKEEMVKR